jgi:hypothetical protein
LFIAGYGSYSYEGNEQRCSEPNRSTQFARKVSRADSIQADAELIFAMTKNIWRAVTEVGFIIFLFDSNLLLGEFERSGMAQKRGIVWAIGDFFAVANLEIAAIAALIGCSRF